MKKILNHLFLLPALALALVGCSVDEIVFDHERSAFDTEAGKILIEAILPTATLADEDIYIAGPFAGDSLYVVGKPQYKLTHSDKISQKWGIYLDPATFNDGKTLADGFYFINVTQGLERSLKNEDILHTLNASVGQRYNVYADRWRAFFAQQGSGEEETLPEHAGSYRVYVKNTIGWAAVRLYMYGDVNDLGGGWPGIEAGGTVTLAGTEYVFFDIAEADAAGKEEHLIFNNGDGEQIDGSAEPVITFADKKDLFFEVVDKTTVNELEAPVGGITYPEHAGTYRVYVLNTVGWDTIRLYMYGDVNDLGGGWPGIEAGGAETLGGEEYFYFDIAEADAAGKTEHLIFNNGNGEQIDGSAEPVVTFGDQKDLRFEVISKAEVKNLDEGETPEPQPEPVKDPVDIYILDNTGWDAIAVYMWGDKEAAGSWPGALPEETTVKIGTVEYKHFVIEDADTRTEHLIFNNNNGGSQLPDYDVVFDKEIFLEVTADGVNALDPRNPEIKILVNNKTDWEEVALYAYGDMEAFGGWPGATPVAVETLKGVDYLVFGLPADAAGKNLNLIFNNNNKGKQLDAYAITVPETEIFLTININYTMGPEEGNPRGEPSTIYVVNKMDWTDLYLYAWGASEIFGGWSGKQGTLLGTWSGNPVYTYPVTAEDSGKEENLIFNNGNSGDGNQFNALKVTTGEDIFLEIENSTCKTITPCVRIYAADNTGWDDLYVYSWGTGEAFGGWAGTKLTETQVIGGVTYKYADVPAEKFGWTANLIFNNNAGTQLENFDCLKNNVLNKDLFFNLTADSATPVE